MSKCPHCGAEVQYSVERKKVHCEYCGSDFNVSELIQEAKKAKKAEEDFHKEKISGKSYLCSQCGATLLSFDETAVTFCSYCGSQNVLEDKLVEQTAPDVIIPFSKTQEECIQNYKKKVNHSLFCPNYMKSDIVVKKFRGIYIPYGIYNFHFSGDCVNKGEKFSHRSGDYKYYDKYDLHADVDSTCNGISYDLLSKFYDDYSQAVPFNYKEAVDFNSNYLPGFYVDSKDVDSSIYHTEAKKTADNLSTNYLKKDRTYAKYSCAEPKVDYKTDDEKTGLFPVYFASIRDKGNKYLYYAMINGQTGKVVADLPVDFKKYFIFSIIMAIPIFLLLHSSLTVLPTSVNLFAFCTSIVGFLIYLLQLMECTLKEARTYDKGYQSTMNKSNEKKSSKNIKSPGKEFLKSAFLIAAILFLVPIFTMILLYLVIYLVMDSINIFGLIFCGVLVILIIYLVKKLKKLKKSLSSKVSIFNASYFIKFVPALLLPVIVYIANPVEDLYYYGTALVSLTFTLLSFYDLVKLHNRLAARPIPQLEKRGGDESE